MTRNRASTRIVATAAALTVVGLVATANAVPLRLEARQTCPSTLLQCGNACYTCDQYGCSNGQLTQGNSCGGSSSGGTPSTSCPSPLLACGPACYSCSQYGCSNGQLTQGNSCGSSSSGGSTGGGSTTTSKKGIAFNNVQCANSIGTAAGWAYNWGQSISGLASGVTFTPMLWSDAADLTSTWPSAPKSMYYLGFNEPDNCIPNTGGSCMTVAQAVTAWRKYMEPLAGSGVTLVSPAVTNGAAPMGQAWLDQFLQECTGCSIGAVALHIYDTASNTAYFQNYMSSAVTKYYNNKGLPVWFTEVGITGGDPVGFIKTMVPFMDNLKGLDRYAYFMAGTGTNQLNNADCSANAAGSTYISTV